MATKKITSNLAQYKNGQLTCIVCQVPVKNELYWTGHVNGRLHRDKLALLKRKAEPQSSSSSKRSRLDEEEPSSSKIKSTIPSKTPPGITPEERIIFKVPQDRKKPEAPVDREANLATNGNLNYDNGSNSISANNNSTESSSIQLDQESPSSSSSQDTSSSSSSSKQLNKSNKKEGIPNLPEGFFDDPKMDAKARGVEYIDPEDAEWDKFVKEIASEELQSESILVVDEEESRKERELDEIEDMMGHWQRVIDLEKKKDTRVKKMDVTKDDESSSGEDDEFGEEMDWRVKKLKKF